MMKFWVSQKRDTLELFENENFFKNFNVCFKLVKFLTKNGQFCYLEKTKKSKYVD